MFRAILLGQPATGDDVLSRSLILHYAAFDGLRAYDAYACVQGFSSLTSDAIIIQNARRSFACSTCQYDHGFSLIYWSYGCMHGHQRKRY